MWTTSLARQHARPPGCTLTPWMSPRSPLPSSPSSSSPWASPSSPGPCSEAGARPATTCGVVAAGSPPPCSRHTPSPRPGRSCTPPAPWRRPSHVPPSRPSISAGGGVIELRTAAGARPLTLRPPLPPRACERGRSLLLRTGPRRAWRRRDTTAPRHPTRRRCSRWAGAVPHVYYPPVYDHAGDPQNRSTNRRSPAARRLAPAGDSGGPGPPSK